MWFSQEVRVKCIALIHISDSIARRNTKRGVSTDSPCIQTVVFEKVIKFRQDTFAR